MTDMVHGSIPAASGDPILPRWWRTIDKWSIAAMLTLMGAGLLLGLAASAPLASRNGLGPYFYVTRQVLFAGLALSVAFALSLLSPKAIRRLATLGFAAALGAVMLLPFFGTDFGKGATRWYSLGFASVQPSEFLKPCFIVVAAWLLSAGQAPNGPPGRLWSFGLAVLVVLLLAMQPDFGQAALILFCWGVMYFVSGAPMTLIVALAGLVVAGGTFAYSASEHFARRIDGFLSPDVDPRTQLGYAANAISEGGLFGVGVGEGQVKWSLPDAHTDFIIAVAAEEFGLVLVLVLIALYATLVLRSLGRAVGERDPFVRLAATGLATSVGMQAVINMGVAVRLLPAKGMTLPFVSYGGSSLVAASVLMGMLLALTRRRPQEMMREIWRGAR